MKYSLAVEFMLLDAFDTALKGGDPRRFWMAETLLETSPHPILRKAIRLWLLDEEGQNDNLLNEVDSYLTSLDPEVYGYDM